MEQYTETKDRRLDSIFATLRGMVDTSMFCLAGLVFWMSTPETNVVSGMLWVLTIYILLRGNSK